MSERSIGPPREIRPYTPSHHVVAGGTWKAEDRAGAAHGVIVVTSGEIHVKLRDDTHARRIPVDAGIDRALSIREVLDTTTAEITLAWGDSYF